MTQPDLDRILASLAMRGFLRFVGTDEDGSVRYEVTEKGRFEIAASRWKSA